MNKSKQKFSSIRTAGSFLFSDKACSGTLCKVIDDAFGYSLNDEERAAMPFAGGIVQNGYQCGMIWGAALAAGAQAYRIYGSGVRAEVYSIIAAQKLVESFRNNYKYIDCFELTDIDKNSSTVKLISYFLIKGGTLKCCRMALKYAPIAFSEINTAFNGGLNEFPRSPVSCTAILAKRFGLSEMHSIMVSGFAGGIGLSGGACGALGAAIWIIGMKKLEEGAEKLNFKNQETLDLIERFLICTNYEFECSKIVSRKFDDVNAHSQHLCNGGCMEIIEVLSKYDNYL
ncbi:MAG: hypothetical protein EPN82_17090 [Bacteroidetes bacterium]|nr:MAG: hypothetical protein EPN82_17090 [Bacteroidota bacterium]